jgi:hypothetical protein
MDVLIFTNAAGLVTQYTARIHKPNKILTMNLKEGVWDMAHLDRVPQESAPSSREI